VTAVAREVDRDDHAADCGAGAHGITLEIGLVMRKQDKNDKKPLLLNTETVRSLREQDLGAINGAGTTTVGFVCRNTWQLGCTI
jgi:hypothetical protein